MSKPTRQRHFGADGEIKFVPHRNLYVGFHGGRVVVTKRTHAACFQVLERDYGVRVTRPVSANVEPVAKIVVGSELQKYVNDKNKWNAMFGKTALSLDSAEDRKTIAGSIDCELSPENLTCDGELSRSQVNAKYRYLTSVGRQLLALDPTVQIYELSY